jgi:hypothetical protein
MKQYIFTALAVAAILTACNSDDIHEADATSTTTITFSMTGDFQLTANDFTRSLEADGKTMTDVWVLDYVGGELKQQLHQTIDDADFGSPTMDLSLGTHHLYFIASRGDGAVLNTTTHALTFTSVRDTFWKDYEITISSGTSSGNRSVTLDRIVTKLKLTFTDAIPDGAAAFNVTPSSWYYGVDYTTGEPSEATANGTITVNIPSSEIGAANEAVSIFGFSPATEWTTDVAVDCKTSGGDVLGSATITSAPFVRNSVSEYTGPLFGDNGCMALSLNTDWSTSYNGTW